jgi:hypothetical protein
MSVLATKYVVNEQGMIVEEIEEEEVSTSEPRTNPKYDDMKYEREENVSINSIN